MRLSGMTMRATASSKEAMKRSPISLIPSSRRQVLAWQRDELEGRPFQVVVTKGICRLKTFRKFCTGMDRAEIISFSFSDTASLASDFLPHESGRPCSTRKEAVREKALPVLMKNRGTLMRNTKPFGSRPGERGTRTRTGRTETGRTAVGRAGSFNPEEPRSSRFRSYGPSLREERLRSFRVSLQNHERSSFQV